MQQNIDKEERKKLKGMWVFFYSFKLFFLQKKVNPMQMIFFI